MEPRKLESYKWRIQFLSQAFIELLNRPHDDPEYIALLRKAEQTHAEEDWNKLEDIKFHIKLNPILHASLVKSHDGRDLYLDREMALRVLRRIPVTIWINGNSPHESPLSARVYGAEVFVGPYEKGSEITRIQGIDNLPFGGNGTEGFLIDNGVPRITTSFFPTRFGLKDYAHKTLDLKTERYITTNEDTGLEMKIFLKYSPWLFSDRVCPPVTI